MIDPQTAYETVQEQTFDLWTSDTGQNNKAIYTAFRREYRDFPDRFVQDCIRFDSGDAPTPYQLECMVEFYNNKRACIRGPHGLGKSAMLSWLLIHFALTNDIDTDWKVATTASVWRQLKRYLWPEVHKWSKRIIWDKIGREPFSRNKELFDLVLRLDTGEAYAVASDDPETIEGAHATRFMYIFDESKIIPAATWDSAEGAFSNGECFWLAVSTPGRPAGRFYDIQKRKPGYRDWWVRHVSKQEMVDSGRMNVEWAENRKFQWGEHSATYQNRVVGEFAASEEDSVIPLHWVELANNRWYDKFEINPHKYLEQPLTTIGVDIGGGGLGDPSSIAYRHGNDILRVQMIDERDTDKFADSVVTILRNNPLCSANIDSLNIGSGVYWKCNKEYPDRTFPFTASASTDAMDVIEERTFYDTRSAAWWNLREMLDPSSGYDVALPPDDEVTGDLCTPTWEESGRATIKVQSKKIIKKDLGRSTNAGDSVVQAFWEGEQEWGMEAA